MHDSLTVMKLVHDLKSPLGALKILESSAELKPEHRKILELSRSFLESLIRNVRSNKALPISGVRIEQIVKQIADQKMIVCPEQAIKITLKGMRDECEVFGDSSGFHRALNNIVENAISAQQSCERNNPIEIEIMFSKREAKITCRDFGPGFQAGSASSRSEGWGLGLSIVREICAENRWRFNLYSRCDLGTWAILTLR